jgi:superfamily II DNA or RNA helicase
MPPAVPACSHARITIDAQGGTIQTHLLALPGIKFVKGAYLVPHHAVENFAERLTECGANFTSARWVRPSPNARAWEEIESYLKEKGEVREFVLDGFLMPYQKDALSFAAEREGTHFWHPTGSGKTCSAILYALMTPGDVVVITRAAARLQYGREWQRFTHCDPYVIRPSSTLRKKDKTLKQYLEEKRDRRVVITAWESLPYYIDDILAMSPTTVIWDEAHLGKSAKRYERIPISELEGVDAMADAALAAQQEADARSKGGFIVDEDGVRAMMLPLDNTANAASRLSRLARRRVATTATAVKDRVRDLWAQLDLVEPYSWGSSTVWKDRYCDRKPGIYGGFDDSGTSNLEELSARLKHVVHHIAYAETHRSLPAKRRQSVYVAPEDQARPSAGFAQEMKAASKRGATAVLEVKLAEAASRKRTAVLGIIEDHIYSGGKLVVFTGRRKDVDVLGEAVAKSDAAKRKGATVWAAHGERTASERQDIVDEYMAHPGPCVLVGTGDSFGESLNMQDTDAALFVMLPYTPGQLRQWEGRFCRLGQKRPVTIYYVIAEGSVDEHVADILIKKLPAVEKVAQDSELAAARDIIAGMDIGKSDEEFTSDILSKIAASESVTEDDLDLEA